MNSKIKMIRRNHIYETAEGDYALANDSRNWWIIYPIVNGEIQVTDEDTIWIDGKYADAVNYIHTVRELRGNTK